MKKTFAKIVFGLWPFHVGVERLMKNIDPPAPLMEETIIKLSGFPLKLKFKPATFMGRFLYYRHMYEEKVIKKLSALLRPGMTFVDVGANIGLYSVIGSHLVGESGKVVAIEPQKQLYRIFYENLTINGLTNVTLIETAAGKASGSANLFQVSETNDGEATMSLREDEVKVGDPLLIPVRTLSEILYELKIEKVDGLKIDVEGAEMEVLEGFADWLKDNPPDFIIFECIDECLRRFCRSGFEIFNYLSNFNYKIYALRHGGWHYMENPTSFNENLRYTPDFLAIKKYGKGSRRESI